MGQRLVACIQVHGRASLKDLDNSALFRKLVADVFQDESCMWDEIWSLLTLAKAINSNGIHYMFIT